MISVMKRNDFELGRKTDIIVCEAQSKGMISGNSGAGVVSTNNVVTCDGEKGSSSDLIGSEENKVSGDDVDSYDNATHGSVEGKSVNLVGSEEIRVSVELENRAPESDIHVRFSINNECEKTSVSEVDWEGVGEEMRSGPSVTRDEDVMPRVRDHKFSSRNSGSELCRSRVEEVGVNSEEKGLVHMTPRASDPKVDVWNGGVGHSGKGHVERGESGVSHYEPLISMFDEFAENWKGKGVGAGLSTSVGFGYEIGDMVWGKVKSHPWWPGHIYNEAFALPSVRRTKRAGHLLVAFFGDSSYGWFDPAEVVPFDPNFLEKSRQEKSRQAASRNFVKAMEEAVDEVSRRCGLGLACRCRNPYNYRPTNVQGYFVVDVDDYEPGAVYSMSQIRKARDSFQPRDTLAFMKQLALTPRNDEQGSIDFIKNKATVLACRKSAFEEFDETYAQAFGKQPVRPSRVPIEAVAQPVRAPLSGPLVIAEALGKRKTSTKSNKAKDPAHKERYLFKRRDEPYELKIQQIGQESSSVQPAYVEGSAELAAGDNVLQKRATAVSGKKQIPAKLEQMVTTRTDGASASNRDASGEVVTVGDKPPVARFSVAGSLANGSKAEPPANFADSFPVSQAPAYTCHLLEQKSYIDKGKGIVLKAKERAGYNAIVDPIIMDSSGLSGKGAFHGGIDNVPHISEEEVQATINMKHDQQTATTSKLVGVFWQPPSLAAIVEEEHGKEQVHSGGSPHVVPAIASKFHGQDSRMRIDKGAKKAKLLKRPVGELGAEKSIPGEKKKKKRKELGMEMSTDRMQKQAATGKGCASVWRETGEPVQVGLPPREHFQIEHQKKDDGARSSLLPNSVGMGNSVPKLSRLLGDLQALALNPFHGVERNSSANVRRAFLKFRTHVYQKSLSMSTLSEMESNEVHAPKSPAGSTAGFDNPPRENIKDMLYSKPPKPLVRSDDPTKGGRKRGPSDCQEELTAKRLKKISDMKSMVAEKKPAQKTPEAQRDGKETMAPRPLKLLKADSIKKMGSPSRAPEPAMLVMKFPPKTTLPSGSELKARLARFGQLDHSHTRIFWKSSTCRVVFIHRVDAEAAHRHLAGNNTLFGNVNMRCHIRRLEAVAPESESKVQREDTPMETLQLRDSAVEQRQPAATAASAQQPLQHEVGQLKSCLKKPVGDEAGGSGVNPRVNSNKFMLGVGGKGEEQLMVIGNKNKFNNASFADGGASSSSSHGMDFNSKNFQKVILPPPLPILPRLPATPPFPNAPNNLRCAAEAVAPGKTCNFNTNTMARAVPSPSNVDIAQQMLSLLTKCNDVVTNVKSFLGYVPYHPL